MNQVYWTVGRARHVATYLIGLRNSGEELRAAVNSLHGGVPPEARKIQENPETWEWLEARHWIAFVVVDRDRRTLFVTDIESATIR